jgi:OB-fold nucleic acid binding domain
LHLAVQAVRAEQAPAQGGERKAAALDEEEDSLDPAAYFANRAAAVQRAKDAGGNPYPHKFHVDFSVPDYIKHFKPQVEAGSHLEDDVAVAGRIQTKRAASSKLLFYDLVGEGCKVQIMADLRVSELAEDVDKFAALHAAVKRGDIVGVRGKPGASKKGELSIFPVHMEVRTWRPHMARRAQPCPPCAALPAMCSARRMQQRAVPALTCLSESWAASLSWSCAVLCAIRLCSAAARAHVRACRLRQNQSRR